MDIGLELGKFFLVAIAVCALVVAWVARWRGRKGGIFAIGAGVLLIAATFVWMAMPIESSALWFSLGWILQVQAPFQLLWIVIAVIAMELGARSRRWFVHR